MVALQERWYKALTLHLDLSPRMFQISLPASPIPSTDNALWAYQNVIPPRSLTFNRSYHEANSFFKEYAAVAGQMQVPVSSLQEDIGESENEAWSAYLKTLPAKPLAGQLPSLFRRWALLKAPSALSAGVAGLTRMVLVKSVRQTLQSYLDTDGRPVDFSGSYDDLLQAIRGAAGTRFSFASTRTSHEVGGTWTGDDDSGVDGLWADSGSESGISSRFAESDITVNARFNAWLAWTSTPGPWYNSSLLNTAFDGPSTPPWIDNASPDWEQFFGPSGSLLRLISSLVIVDGIELTFTSNGAFTTSDQQTILANAPRGLWPFYAATADAVTNSVRFDADSARFEIAMLPGHPLVIGNNVLGIAAYLGH